MSVGAKFKDKLGKIKAHLTRLDDQQLGKAALVIILFLDIFILIAIFNGLDEHTRQLSSPDAYIPNPKNIVEENYRSSGVTQARCDLALLRYCPCGYSRTSFDLYLSEEAFFK